MRRTIPKIVLFLLVLSVFTFAVNDRVHASTPIKVLNVSAFCYNEVREITNIAGASSLFEVTQVGILDFNNGNPSNLSTYNVIVFGISNRFEGPDAYYTPYAGVIGRISELKDYVNHGGGIVWTHDSLETGNDYGANAEEPAGVDFTLPGSAIGSATAKIINEHEVLHYPFEVGNVGDTIGILQTHTWYGTVTTATIVMAFDGQPASSGNFYLAVHEYSYGRTAVIELGCLTLMEYDGTFGSWPSVRESEIFVNALYWAGTAEAEPSPLATSIIPLGASIFVGQSVTFMSTVSGGYIPYDYQWYLNGVSVSGATTDIWIFTASAHGIFSVYLKVTDAEGNTTQSTTTYVTVELRPAFPVGGYSFQARGYVSEKKLMLYLAAMTILTASFAVTKYKPRKRSNF